MKTDPHALLRASLANTREAAGITQAELARRLNKPQSYVSKIETGERGIDLIELIDLLEAIPVDFCSFIDGFLRKRRTVGGKG